MTNVPRGFEGSVVCVTREQVYDLLPSMKRDSGPGHPWVELAKTKGEIIDRYREMLVDAVLETVELWGNTPHGSLPEDPVELIEKGFSAPMRTFVKNEPHASDKIESGRLRLIIMVPMHLVLAEMLIFGTQNNEEIAHWAEIPSKPGLGLAEDHHIKSIFEEVDAQREKVAQADVSGFDFSLCEEFFKYDAKRRVRLAGAEEKSIFANACYNAHHVMCRAVYALSDGRMFKQLHPGVMKSGRYVTSSTNSFIRVMLAFCIGALWAIAMGDDSLETAVDDAQQRYARLGLTVKFYDLIGCPTSFDFCSHIFQDGVAWPSKPGKMLYNLLSQSGTESQLIQQFQQWFFEMRHHPQVDEWTRVIERSGWAAQNNGTKELTPREEECSTQE